MAAINNVVDITLDAGLAIVTLDSPPVNALSGRLVDGMARAFVQAIDDPAVDVILLICAGRTFIAGADLNDLAGGAGFFDLQSRIEAAGKPVVAAIHGSCLGGGLEVALTCNYRVAVPSARLGLPEVNLGLLPGGGGTQRLPRIVGIDAALDLLVSGRQVGAAEALAFGLLDALVAEDDLRGGGIAFSRALVDQGAPVKRVRDRTDRMHDWTPQTFADARAKAARERVGEVAPLAIIRCVESAAAGDFDAGIEVERIEFDGVVDGVQSAALRYVFFAERQAAKVPGLQKDVGSARLEGVGLVGDRAVALVPLLARCGMAPVTEAEGLAASELLLLAATGDVEAQRSQLLSTLEAHPEAIVAIDAPDIPIETLLAGAPRAEAAIGLRIGSAGSGSRLVEIVRWGATGPAAVATAIALARKLGKVGIISSGGPGMSVRLQRAASSAFAASVESGIDATVIAQAAADYGFGPDLFALLDLSRPMPAGGDTDVLNRLLFGVIDEALLIVAEGVAIRESDVDMAAILGLGWPARTGGPLHQLATMDKDAAADTLDALGLASATMLRA